MKRVFLTILICLLVFCAACPKRADVPVQTQTLLERHGIEHETDIVYKTVDGKELLLDIYMPAREVYEKAPVAVYIHGGGFVSGYKENALRENFRFLTFDMLNAGYAVVSIEYRLVNGSVVFPVNIEDCADAVRWVRKAADEYGFDGRNIGVWGTSAGGHLSLMTGFAGDEFEGAKELEGYSAEVNWVVDFFGPTDLTTAGDIRSELKVINSGFLFFGIKAQDGEYTEAQQEMILTLSRQYSPVYYISQECPPALIIHGTEDSTVDAAQSDVLFDALQESGADAEYLRLDGVEHGLGGISKEQSRRVSEAVLKIMRDNYFK